MTTRGVKAFAAPTEVEADSKELLPCPFCGSAVTVNKHTVFDNATLKVVEVEDAWEIECPACECRRAAPEGWAYFSTREEAVTTWNTRASVSAPVGEVSETLPNNQRLLDLVRFCRHQLHDEKLITNEEFAALVSVGAQAARRLEDYDAVNAERDSLRAVVVELEAVIEDMRSENRLHGHMTDALAKYLHHVKPKVDALKVGEQETKDLG